MVSNPNPNKEKALLLWLSKDDRDFIAQNAKSIQTTTGRKASSSSVIRALIARYRREVKDNPKAMNTAVLQHHS